MKKRAGLKYGLELLLILCLTLAGIWLVVCLPFDKQYGYNQLLESCGRGNWMYSRIFENKTPVDIALIGSSRTICGVQDSLLERLLPRQEHVVNLAFCRYGRSLHYAIFKDLLRHHRPQMLILEVNERESRFSHPDFPCIAEGRDLIFPINRQGYVEQLVLGAQCRVEFYLKKWMGELPEFRKDTRDNFYAPHPQEADPKTLTARQNEPLRQDGFEKKWVYYTSKYYLKKMAHLTKERGIQLRFLYLPSFGKHTGKPAEYDFYHPFGEVLIPPDSIFLKPVYWIDGDHLNDNGAALLTRWLAEQF